MWTLDVEIYDEYGDGFWAQDRYLVHGTDDVVWTSDIDAAVEYLRSELLRIEGRYDGTANRILD